MKRIVLLITAVALTCASANAQSLLKKLGERAKNAAEQNIGNKVEKGVNDVLNGNVGKKDKSNNQDNTQTQTAPATAAADGTWTCPNPECGHTGNTGKFCTECGTKKPADGASAQAPTTAQKKQVESSYAKTDFVPGDEIFFEDTFENEKQGEFPSQWDLIDGYLETGTVDGRKVMAFTDDGYAETRPLMKDPMHFLPDVFTLEFDMYLEPGEGLDSQELEIAFGNPDLENWNGRVFWINFWFRADDGGSTYIWNVQKPNGGEDINGEKDLFLGDSSTPLKAGGWNHFAFSFNKRALKGYINGIRIMSVPTAKVPSHFWFHHQGTYKYSGISNVRLAKGAVPLYDRLASEGKIITYAITFDTGKATLKPEADVEINRIKELMVKDASIKFEVQGHCDNTGSDAVNDPLSQKRAEAIVARLVKMGIAKDRLTAVGKGSHEPIANNGTKEGRAKNRRVEFVKL